MKNKGNDGKGNNEERDLWETDQALWDTLNQQYQFTFDCCANQSNTKCKSYSSNFEETNFSDVTFFGKQVFWMNPPFSKAKEMFKHFFKEAPSGVAIFRCDNMETKVWQEIILKNADWIHIPQGRIAYTPFSTKIRSGKGTRFPSALIGFKTQPPKNIEGTTLMVKK